MGQTKKQLQAALLLLQDLDPRWPGFVPASTPFLVFGGQDTHLLGAVPPVLSGWSQVGDDWTFGGRHPQVYANTALLLDDVLPVATLLLDELPEHLSPRQLAAIAAHEAFHVHQGQHPSPAWITDERVALSYPVGDEAVLRTRAMETASLERALSAGADWPVFAAQALCWRAQRFQRLAAEHAEYERSLERVEGLAHHLELGVLGALPTLPLPDVPAEHLRRRTYATGAAYAALLGRLGGHWQADIERNGTALDRLLRHRLPGQDERVVASPLFPSEAVRRWARQEAEAVRQRRQQAVATFESLPGQRLTLRVGSREPLWPSGFDPLNLQGLGDGSLLHRRFLRFGNAGAEGEVLGSTCRTWGVNGEALGQGFSRVELVGVQWEEQPGGLQVTGPGISVWITGGRAQRDEEGWSCEV